MNKAANACTLTLVLPCRLSFVRSFWKKRISQEELLSTAAKVQADAWKTQADAGIDLIGLDGTLYDQVSAVLIMLAEIIHMLGKPVDGCAIRKSDVKQFSVVVLLCHIYQL
jgi:Cobalamin-independent synthase, N-terminal domain